MGIFSRRQQQPPARRGSPAASAPRVPEDYYVELLTSAAFPITIDNLQAVLVQVGEMFLIKSGEFIGSTSHQDSLRFIGQHAIPRPASVSHNQAILDDLVKWDADVANYIDDLPERIRRIMLQSVGHDGTLFGQAKDSSLLTWIDSR